VGQSITLFSGSGAANPSNFSSVQSDNPALKFTFTNGVLKVASIMATNPTNLTYSVTDGGSTLALSWPADHLGWILQTQTNPLDIGISNNWVNVPGSSLIITTNFPIDVTKPTMFFRLIMP
jgi:hypothetical protein